VVRQIEPCYVVVPPPHRFMGTASLAFILLSSTDDRHDVMPDIDTSTKLADLFATNRERDWYFVSPGGNWGDQLIYAGAESLARSVGLRWINRDFRSIDSAPPPAGACIFLHGGGGLNPWCSGRAFATLSSALKIPGALVIQGPQTCDTESDDTRNLFASTLADTVAAEVHFFVRETTSARFLAEVFPPAFSLHVEQDTAFNLSQHELLALAGLRKIPKGRYSLVVSREDDEADTAPLVAGEGAVQLDPARYARSFSHWLRIHAFATHIVTNRLHSAIVGTLFGKPVTLLPGSYHKNRSIWEFSLKERGVEWCDRHDSPAETVSSMDWLPRRIRNSWKVQRALLRFRGVPFS